MNNAPADPLSWYYDIPIATRVYLTGAFVTTVSPACSLAWSSACVRYEQHYHLPALVLYVQLNRREGCKVKVSLSKTTVHTITVSKGGVEIKSIDI